MDLSSQLTTSAFEFVRLYLACFFTFVAVFYTVRVFLMKRKQSKEIVLPGERMSASWKNHMVFRAFRLAIWWACVIRWIVPEFDRYLGLFTSLQLSWVILTGSAMMVLGFAMALAGHFSLGQDWRSGFDREAPSHLHATGLYRFSRNPIFLGVAVGQIGFFVALPSVFSLICMIVGLRAVHRQTVLEEGHLESAFAEEYVAYKSKVRRWV